MRKKKQKQMPLIPPKIDHPQAHELEAISRIICQKSTIIDHVMQDLYKDQRVHTNSSLLWDAVRVLTRLLHKVQNNYRFKLLHFQDHQRRAKKRMVAIQYAKTNKQRKPAYKDLLKVTRKSIRYANSAINQINSSPTVSTGLMLLGCKKCVL